MLETTPSQESLRSWMPRFEIFEIIVFSLAYAVRENEICFWCVVAFQKVLVDTSASQTIGWTG